MTAFGDGSIAGRFDPRKAKMPVPATGIFDEPNHCVSINVEWRGYLIGVIERLAWGDVWVGDEDAQYGAVQEIYKLVDAMAKGGCDMPTILRQNPNNLCVLQYSVNDGDTWQDAFDYSQCLSIATSETVAAIQLNWNVSIEYNADTMDTYSGDIVNVAPNFEFVGGGQDAGKKKAMCYAIGAYVDMVCDGAIALINDQNDDTEELVGVWRNVASAAGVISSALAVVGLFPAAAILAGLSFATSAILVDIAAQILAEDASSFADLAARKAVRCAMYENMKGWTPEIEDWETSASSPLTGNAEIIRDVVDQSNQSEESFVQLFIAFNDAVPIYEELAECPCLPPLVPFIVDFDDLTTGDFSIAFEDVPEFTASIPGVLQSAVAGNPQPSAKMPFGSSDVSGLPGFAGRVRITLPALRDVSDVDFEIYFTHPGNDVIARTITLLDQEEGVLDTEFDDGDNGSKLDWGQTFAWTGIADMCKYIDVTISVVGAGLVPGTTYGYIDNVSVS